MILFLMVEFVTLTYYSITEYIPFTLSDLKKIKIAIEVDCNEGIFKRMTNSVGFTAPTCDEKILKYQEYGRNISKLSLSYDFQIKLLFGIAIAIVGTSDVCFKK